MAYLMLIRYCARATDSVLPVMLIVRSKFAGASRSSQFEIRIMAPESCLAREMKLKKITQQTFRIVRYYAISQSLTSRFIHKLHKKDVDHHKAKGGPHLTGP